MRASSTGAVWPRLAGMAIATLSATTQPEPSLAQPASPSRPPSPSATNNTHPQSSAPQCSGFIDGHVVDDASHEPVARAAIVLNGKNVDFSDSYGRFQLRALCAGLVTLEARRPDYFGKPVRVALRTRASVELQLQPRGDGTTMDDVVIIEGQPARNLGMVSTSELSGDALARTRGRAFTDALIETPGVAPLRSATGVAQPIIRGQFGRRLTLLVDGVRLRSQNWGLDHAPEIDPFTADRITVVRGAAGVRYGPDAIGGAILVDPAMLSATPGVSGEAHMLGLTGQGGSLATRVRFAPVSVPGMAALFEGSLKRLASPSTPDYALDNTGSSESNFGVTVGYRRGLGQHQLSYRQHAARLGVCSCLRIESLDDFFASIQRERPINADLFEAELAIDRPFQSVDHHTALARSSWQLPGIDLFASYGWQLDQRDEFDVVRTAAGPQVEFDLTSHDAEVGLEHKPVHVNDHWHLRGSAGVVGMGQRHSFASTAPLSLLPNYRARTGGVYAIERLLGHDFEMEAGVRYDALARRAIIAQRDFARLIEDGQLDAGDCNDADGDFMACRSSFHTLSATLGGLMQLAPQWSVKLDVSTGSRAPHPDEQYLNGKTPISPVFGLGDPTLGAETTYSGSLITAFASDMLSLEGSVYGNYIDGYIYTAPAFDSNGNVVSEPTIRGEVPVFATRPVDARFYGVDGGIVYRPVPALELTGQGAAVRARNLTDNTFLAFVPPDRLRAAAAYNTSTSTGSDQFRVSVAGTWVARQDRVDPSADLAPPPDAYFLLDAQVGWTTTINRQQVTLAAHGTNLLNTRYRDYTSLLRYFADQPGTQVLLRLTLRFSIPQP